MKTITTQQMKSLEDKVYQTLINITITTEDGYIACFGMGEMGEVREQAQITVSEWMDENNITEL